MLQRGTGEAAAALNYRPRRAGVFIGWKTGNDRNRCVPIAYSRLSHSIRRVLSLSLASPLDILAHSTDRIATKPAKDSGQ